MVLEAQAQGLKKSMKMFLEHWQSADQAACALELYFEPFSEVGIVMEALVGLRALVTRLAAYYQQLHDKVMHEQWCVPPMCQEYEVNRRNRQSQRPDPTVGLETTAQTETEPAHQMTTK